MRNIPDAISLWIGDDKASLIEGKLRILFKEIDSVNHAYNYCFDGSIIKRISFLIDFNYVNGLGASRQKYRLFLSVKKKSLLLSLGSILCNEGKAVQEEMENFTIVRPTWITRFLIPGAGVIMGTFYAKRRLELIFSLASDIGIVSCNLFVNWIWRPFLDIWKTIRYRSTRFALLNAETLVEDKKSLERMIANFSGGALVEEYERQLQNPIKNALFGDLPTILLIQVQKSKVVLEEAIIALDQLLKANELNFELLAVIPIVWVLVSTNNYIFFRNRDQARIWKLQKLFYEIQKQSDLQRELILANTMILVQQILIIWKDLSGFERYSDDFVSDLKFLLKGGKDFDRMYRFYPFLSANLST